MSSTVANTNQGLDIVCKDKKFLHNSDTNTDDQKGSENKTKAQKRSEYVDTKYSLHKSISKHVPAVAQCQKPINSNRIGVSKVGYTNLSTCKNKLCPHCLIIKEEKEKKRVKEYVDKSFMSGFKLLFLTFTTHHNKHEKYENLFNLITQCYSYMLKNDKYKRLCKKYNVKGFIKKIETSVSLENGWHPHIHLLLILDTEKDTIELTDAIYDMWKNANLKHHGKVVSKECYKAIKIANETGISSYMAKSWRIESEMSLSSKKDNKGTSTHPIYLAKLYETKDKKKYLSLLKEYDSLKGKNTITTSKNLNSIFDFNVIKEYQILLDKEKKEKQKSSKSDINEVLFYLEKNLYKIIASNYLQPKIFDIINTTYYSDDDYWKLIYKIILFLDFELVNNDISFKNGLFYLVKDEHTIGNLLDDINYHKKVDDSNKHDYHKKRIKRKKRIKKKA